MAFLKIIAKQTSEEKLIFHSGPSGNTILSYPPLSLSQREPEAFIQEGSPCESQIKKNKLP